MADSPLPLAERSDADLPGHWLLARLGKRVLRPGGLELTTRLLAAARIGGSDVVELGPIGSDRPRTVRLTPWSGERLFSACARRRDGTVWCWGSNQCDLEDATVTGTPAVPNECEWQFTSAPWQIELPTQASSIVVGRSHACALLEDDSVWCWGSNVHGQLGDGTQVDSVVPVRVVGLPRTL